MIPLVSEHLAELAAVCRKHKVARLELFGSAATSAFDPARSDLDFLVEYLPRPSSQVVGTYFGLIEDLEQLFGRKVDLVEERFIKSDHFRRAAAKTRARVYALEDTQAP